MWDLLANFTARWRKQAGTLHARKLAKMQEARPAALSVVLLDIHPERSTRICALLLGG